jgi:hypothetical protein
MHIYNKGKKLKKIGVAVGGQPQKNKKLFE